MGDYDQLGDLRQRAQRFAVAFHIPIVQWRIDLIENTERCRVQLEECKQQCHSGKRLLATRQQVDRAVSLARRSRHHCDSRRQQIILRQFEHRTTPTEQLRKEVRKALIQAVEGGLESFPGLTVNLADDAGKGIQRLYEVSVL